MDLATNRYRGARVLVFLYEDSLTDRDERCRPETDAQLLALYDRAVALHTDAWILFGARTLPRWWRLVREIRAERLSDGSRDRVAWPMSEAALRTAGLALATRPYETQGWRQVRTGPDRGRVVRVRESRRTSRLVEVQPDTRLRYPEAFTEVSDDATVHDSNDPTLYITKNLSP